MTRVMNFTNTTIMWKVDSPGFTDVPFISYLLRDTYLDYSLFHSILVQG